MKKHRSYYAGAMVIAIFGVVWTLGPGPGERKEAGNSLARPVESSTLSRRSVVTDRDASSGNRIAISPRLVRFLQLDVFEEDTGEVTNQLLRSFQVTKEDRAEIRQAVGDALEEFKAVELEKAQVISNPENTYFQLADCGEAAEVVFARLYDRLEPLWANPGAGELPN